MSVLPPALPSGFVIDEGRGRELVHIAGSGLPQFLKGGSAELFECLSF